MPLLGGFRITHVGWSGRLTAYVDFETTETDRYFQLYVNRRLAGVTSSVFERRVDGQLWGVSQSASPLTLVSVSASERFTDFGDTLRISPWNRYTLQFSVPEDYAADIHHFKVLGASLPDTVPTKEIANIMYAGPRSYSIDLPAIPTIPLSLPVDTNEPSRWQDWLYWVVPYDDAYPKGNAGTQTLITIPALIYPDDLQLRSDGNRFGLTLIESQLTVSYAVA